MLWDGNMLWRGVLPAQSGSGLIEYYVTAVDFANNLGTGPTKSFTLTLACAADVAPAGSPNHAVDVNDLLAVVSTWGVCPGCPPAHCQGDIAPVVGGVSVGDCQINVNDLLAVISTWGACP
jgi:hypothetical protein